jgi:CoA:oxalate CoA-transferase
LVVKKTRPLEGLVVLGVEQFIAGPYCTMILADQGAEVIKIERPGVGDPRRTMGPYLTTGEGKRISGGFLEYNRNKKSVTLNMKDPEGVEILKMLAGKADVLVENFSPGTMSKLGLGYETLSQINPRLVYAAVSGFGQLPEYLGPYSSWPALDIISEAMGGVMHMIGFEDRPPTSTIYGLADTYSGVVTSLGIMFALWERQMSGLGQFVDTSMYDAALAMNERAIATYSLTGEVSMRGIEKLVGPRGAFMASDGYVALNIPTDDFWKRLTKVIERPELAEDPRAKDGPTRAENAAFIREAIEAWMKGKTKDEVVRALLAVGVPAGPVQTAKDIAECPHVEARKMLVEVDDPDLGPKRFARTPARLSRASEVPGRHAPRLGEHTEEVLARIGYTPAQVSDLRGRGVV